MVVYEKVKLRNQVLCASCSPYLVHGEAELPAKIAAMEAQLRVERPVCHPSHTDFTHIIKTLLFIIFAKPMDTMTRMTDEVYKKVVGDKGQGSIRAVLFWTPQQFSLLYSSDTLLQCVALVGPWAVGKTLLLQEVARRRAAQDPSLPVTFCVVKAITDKSPMLELSMKTVMADLPNVRVTSLRVDYPRSLMTILEDAIRNTPGDFYVDEVILPVSKFHATLTSSLQHLVSSLSPGRRLWLGVAGMKDGQDQHLDQSYLLTLLSPLHLPDMRTPLRSCRSILQAAGLGSGASSGTLRVGYGASGQTSIQYQLPQHLLGGLPSLQLTFSPASLDQTMARARQEMARRLGPRGIPVISTSAFSRDGQAVVAAVTAARPGTPPLTYTTHTLVAGQATEVTVSGWLARRERGEEERDLVIDEEVIRGWETDAAIVVVYQGGGGKANCVMRAVAHVITLTEL